MVTMRHYTKGANAESIVTNYPESIGRFEGRSYTFRTSHKICAPSERRIGLQFSHKFTDSVVSALSFAERQNVSAIDYMTDEEEDYLQMSFQVDWPLPHITTLSPSLTFVCLAV